VAPSRTVIIGGGAQLDDGHHDHEQERRQC